MSESIVKPSTPFVGREPELSQLHQTLQTVINSQKPEFVLIQGDYGVGKTALVEHFLAEVSLQNSHLLIGLGKCAMENESSGLVPFAQLFTSLANQGVKRRAVLGNLFNFAKEVAPAWLDIVTAGAASATVKTVDESRKLRGGNTFSQENVFVQFTNALSRLAKKHPVIAFIDDLHWADASSLGLLFHLARNLQDRGVLFITTYRPVEAMETSVNAPLFREIRANLIRHGALELEIRQGIDIVQYVTQRYPLNAFPSDLIKRIQEQTGGHALFVSQVFLLWEDKGIIAANPTPNGPLEWRVIDNADVKLVIPQTLSEVLAGRIRSMSDDLREILVCASVEGEDFTVQTIARLRQLNSLKAYDSLEVLEHHYYLVQENGMKQIGQNILDFYRFAHRFFRDHVYNQLAAGKKRILHRQVAECLETLYFEKSEIAGQLARHFREANDLMKSAQYALMSAQYEQSRYALEEGERWCEFGLELVDRLPSDAGTIELHVSLLEQSGYGHYNLGYYSVADERYRKALTLTQQIGYTLKEAELCNKLVYVCFDAGRIDDAVRLLDRARKILSDESIPLGELHLDIEGNWAFAQARLGKRDLALATFRKTLNDSRTLPQTHTLDYIKREVYSGLAIVLSDFNYEKAIAAFQEATKIDTRLGREYKLATDLIDLADTYMRMGELNQSRSYAARGEEMARRIGSLSLVAYVKTINGDTLLALGNPRDAIREFTEAIAIAEGIGDVWYISYMYAGLALAYRALPDLYTAYQKAVLGLDHAERIKYQFELGYALDALAQVESAKREWEIASLHFVRAITIYQNSGYRHYVAQSQCHFAEMLIAQGNRQEAIKLLEETMQVFQEFNLSYEVIKAQKLMTIAMGI